MKRTFTIALVFSCFFLCHAQEADLTVKSKIERVTVFLEGAQVTRLGNGLVKTRCIAANISRDCSWNSGTKYSGGGPRRR